MQVDEARAQIVRLFNQRMSNTNRHKQLTHILQSVWDDGYNEGSDGEVAEGGDRA